MGGKIVNASQINIKKFSLTEEAKDQDPIREDIDPVEEKLKQSYQQGFEDGYKKAILRLEEQIHQLSSVIKELLHQKTEIIKQTELELVELAFKIAQKIIEINLERDKELVLQILKKAISEVKDKSQITVYISPEDEPIILENKNKILESIEGQVKFISDPNIPKGGCIIQTSSGRIDALITTQLDEIKRRIGAK